MPEFKAPSPAAQRGTGIHSEGENYLLNKTFICPPSYQKVSGHLMGLKARKAIPEMKMAVNEKWEPVDYKASDAYFRGIVDVHYIHEETLHVEDFKTGQIYSSHPAQMEVYTALAVAEYPEVKYITTRLVYVDQGIVTPPKTVEVSRVKPIRMLMDGRIKIAEEETIFPATPSADACRFCGYKAKDGGPCTVAVNSGWRG
jgi:hypothetical protein